MSEVEQDYSKLKVAEFTYWNLFLHQDQAYLGRCYLAYKTDDVNDIFDLRKLQRDELHQVGRRVQIALTEMFRPDRFNQASFGNTWNHLHVHIIPRYEFPRAIRGHVFMDKNWGRNYSPYESLKPGEDFLLKLRDDLENRLI